VILMTETAVASRASRVKAGEFVEKGLFYPPMTCLEPELATVPLGGIIICRIRNAIPLLAIVTAHASHFQEGQYGTIQFHRS
jgi:hypothetical protein